MKCEKCKGKRSIIGLGFKEIECPRCNGFGVETEEVVVTEVTAPKKRGRPKKNDA